MKIFSIDSFSKPRVRMGRLSAWFLVSSLAVSNVVFARGGDVGNSGGFALCQDGRYYSYDFLLTVNLKTQDREVTDLQTDFKFIYAQLVRLQDPLAQEFKDFFSNMYQQGPNASYRWLPQPNLPLLWEPDLEGKFPPGCQKRKQAVVYFSASDGMKPTYSYDPQFISQVHSQNNGPLQVSYLWVHEWLWNHFRRQDFMQLAIFNRLLHSKALSMMSAQDYAKYRPK